VTMHQLLQMFKSSDFSKIPSEIDEIKSRISMVKDCDLLLVDDAFDSSRVYVTKKTNYYLMFLEDFFKSRHSNNKSHIFISEKRRHDIDRKFGESLRGLLNKDCLEIELLDVIPQKLINQRVLEWIKSQTKI